LARATRPAGSRRARPRRASSPNATDTPRRRAYALANTDAAKALAARTAEIAKQTTDKGLVRADNNEAVKDARVAERHYCEAMASYAGRYGEGGLGTV